MALTHANTKTLSSLNQQTLSLVTGWRRVLSAEDKRQLDMLIGVALLDDDVRYRLIIERDELLFDDFQLSDYAKQVLRDCPANTLSDLAQAVIAHLQSMQSPLEALTVTC